MKGIRFVNFIQIARTLATGGVEKKLLLAAAHCHSAV